MKPLPLSFAKIALACVLMAEAPLLAVPGGEISTLPTGRYHCEKQTDSTGLIATRVQEHDFRVLISSSYAVNDQRGSYLLTGDRMVMTGGPFEGRQFLRISEGSVRLLGPDGSPTGELCVVVGRGIR